MNRLWANLNIALRDVCNYIKALEESNLQLQQQIAQLTKQQGVQSNEHESEAQ